MSWIWHPVVRIHFWGSGECGFPFVLPLLPGLLGGTMNESYPPPYGMGSVTRVQIMAESVFPFALIPLGKAWTHLSPSQLMNNPCRLCSLDSVMQPVQKKKNSVLKPASLKKFNVLNLLRIREQICFQYFILDYLYLSSLSLIGSYS